MGHLFDKLTATFVIAAWVLGVEEVPPGDVRYYQVTCGTDGSLFQKHLVLKFGRVCRFQSDTGSCFQEKQRRLNKPHAFRSGSSLNNESIHFLD